MADQCNRFCRIPETQKLTKSHPGRMSSYANPPAQLVNIDQGMKEE